MKSILKQSNLGNGVFKNEFFRKILHTSKYLQVEILNLKPGEEIDLETHESRDQYLGFRGGKGKCTIEGHEYIVENGDVILIPAGSGSEVTKFECHPTAKINDNVFTSMEANDSMKKIRRGSAGI
jgi:mannose-6-phosphate isomerase-like protein (cupin superfamily)